MPACADLVFRKTDKAREELLQRTWGLDAQARQVLILIDGHRRCRDLGRMVPDEALHACLAQLEADGYIVPAPAVPAVPAGTMSLSAKRRAAVTALLDAAGPDGDALAIRLGSSRSEDELRALLPAAVSIVEAVAGRDAGTRFARRIAAL